jgi:hypothetical protein
LLKNARIKASVFLGFFFALIAEGSLCDDSAAMTGFAGLTSFNITLSEIELKVDVEYAVYAPGMYPGNNIGGGDEYVYAYQVINNSRSDVAVDFFSVGIISGVTVNTVYSDATYDNRSAFGVEPSTSSIFAQSAGFIFAGESLDSKKWSSVLIFSSVYLPAIGFGTVSGGGLCGIGDLPAPSSSIVPEPATIVMMAPALLILKIRK